MKNSVGFPIRLKIMISLLFGITAVLTVITVIMANFFHDDKQSYLRDWVSIAAVTTADEGRELLGGYVERLETAAIIMLSEHMEFAEREVLLGRTLASLPELVEIAIFQDGEQIELLSSDGPLLTGALTPTALEGSRADRFSALGSVVEREARVRAMPTIERPAFTVAFPVALPDEPPAVVMAVVRSTRLQQLGSNFKVFEIVLVDDHGTLLAHPDVTRVLAGESAGIDAAGSGQEFQAGIAREYVREGREVIGGTAPASYGVTIGAHIPKASAYLASRQLLRHLSIVAVVLLVVVAIIGRLWARRIVRPMERLSEATRSIAQGAFDVEIDVTSRDEIGELALSFNRMATGLQERDEAIETAQSQLVQSEKMSAFGQLGAGIAHEVKNPLAGILGCAQVAMLDAEPGSHLEGHLQLIEKETTRCAAIINNLMKFARQGKTELEPTQINLVVNDAAAIINHQLQMHHVHIIQELDDALPDVLGNSNQLQQVLMNLMINAQQAMEEADGGTVKVTTCRVDDEIEIKVRDDGPGIAEENLAKLFEPFFTTKETGKGTGLGLSVTFGIIKEHRGDITVDSVLGEGTEFTIRLPAEVDGTPSEAV